MEEREEEKKNKQVSDRKGNVKSKGSEHLPYLQDCN